MGIISDKVVEAKAWYQSKTFIGLILALLPTLLKAIDSSLDLNLIGGVTELFSSAEAIAVQADPIWQSILTLVGVIVAAYGRIKAAVGIKPLT